MKKIMEQMAEELSAAFEKAGYDPPTEKLLFPTDRTYVSISVTVLWQEPKHITRHRL